MGEDFLINVGARLGFIMSPWLFTLRIDAEVKEVQARTFGRQSELVNERGEHWVISQFLFVNETVILAEQRSRTKKVGTESG